MSGPVLVEVVWDDAYSSGLDNVTVKEHRHSSTVMQTCGWCLRDDDKGVSVANERCLDDGDESYRGHTFIPRLLIRSVTPIIKTRAKRKVKPNTDEVAKQAHL